ncbi:hypothetical protein KP509_39G033000 [Ceratopteris richardii]|nr:hypothetical protein KP509_39G033000 [Ceratopteris richardii]
MVTPRADPLALSVYNADDGAKLLPNAPCLELAISTTQPAHLAHNGPIISHGKPAETLQTKKDTLAIVKQGCMSNALVRKTRTQKKSPSRICPLSEQRIYLLAEEEGKRMVYTTALLKSPRHREKEIFSAFVDHTWAKIRGHHPPSVHSAALVHVS